MIDPDKLLAAAESARQAEESTQAQEALVDCRERLGRYLTASGMHKFHSAQIVSGVEDLMNAWELSRKKP